MKMNKIKFTDYFLNIILQGKKNPHVEGGYALYDAITISKDMVVYSHKKTEIAYIDLPDPVDLLSGESLTIDMGEGKNKIKIE